MALLHLPAGVRFLCGSHLLPTYPFHFSGLLPLPVAKRPKRNDASEDVKDLHKFDVLVWPIAGPRQPQATEALPQAKEYCAAGATEAAPLAGSIFGSPVLVRKGGPFLISACLHTAPQLFFHAVAAAIHARQALPSANTP